MKFDQEGFGFGNLALPIQQQQQQSALDTLAEVSRHHLDYSAQREPNERAPERNANPIISDILAEQALIAQLQEQANIPPQQTQSTAEVSLATTAAVSASPLVQAASAASQQLEQSQAESIQQKQIGSFIDPQLHDLLRPLQPRPVFQSQVEQGSSVDYSISGADPMSWNATAVTVRPNTFGSLSMPPDEPSGFGVMQSSSRNKTRARFNDARRKEVQEIRKRGACIRCRMLKKPCSEETPCNTCKNVESARLWKGTCIRTRLADEFTLWSTNLFHSRANMEIQASVHSLEQFSLAGCIEGRFLASSHLCFSFAVKECSESPSGIDPGLPNESGLEPYERRRIWLLDESESIAEKLGRYADAVVDITIEEESSAFLRVSLQRAQALIREEEAELVAKVADTPGHTSTRSCYNLQNELLKNVVELWELTGFLTSAETNVLQLRYESAQLPRQQSGDSDWVGEARGIPDTSLSYRMIRLQLMAAIESRSAKLSRTVMNELERRLLQRQQVSRFATFLSAVILLNCVERMSGLYRRLDTGDQTISPPAVERDDASGEQTVPPRMETVWADMSYRTSSHPNFWPLDTPPSTLWPQGSHFSKLLTMLLRMRALPPKTGRSIDGSLAVIQDYAIPVHVSGRPVKEPIDEQTMTAAAWLDPVKLSVGELAKKRSRPLPGKDDPVEAWNMVFISHVLLPEKMR